MKVLQLALWLLIIIDLYEISKADDSLNPITEKKRPFCNAFTGCGRKRDNAMPAAPYDFSGRQIPLLIYRALLRLIAAEAKSLPASSKLELQRSNGLSQRLRPGVLAI